MYVKLFTTVTSASCVFACSPLSFALDAPDVVPRFRGKADRKGVFRG